MSRRRSDADALAALIGGLLFAIAFAIRHGWPVFPSLIAFWMASESPVAGVVWIVIGLLCAVALITAWRLGPESPLALVWSLAQRHPVITSVLVIGPVVFAPCGIVHGSEERADEAQRQVAMAREASRQDALARENVANQAAERERAAQAERERQQAAATAAAAEAARPAWERARLAVMAVRNGDLQGAHRLLDPISPDDRCVRQVADAFRSLHNAEVNEWRRARDAALGGRMALCCDGEPSPSCECNNIRSGCCSHHGGVCGCERVDTDPAPEGYLHCRTIRETFAAPTGATASTQPAVRTVQATPMPAPHAPAGALPPVETHRTCYRSDGTPQRVPVAVPCTALGYTDHPDGRHDGWGVIARDAGT